MIRFKVDKPQFTDFGNVMKWRTCIVTVSCLRFHIKLQKINDGSSYDKFVFLY